MSVANLEWLNYWSKVFVVVFTLAAAIAGVLTLLTDNMLQRPRSLTQRQQAAMIVTLRSVAPTPVVDIMTINSDPESAAFGTQIANTLQQAGWGTRLGLYVMPPGMRGLLILVQSMKQVPNDALILKNALEQVGLQVSITDNPPPIHGVIGLVVGRKR